MICMYQTNFQGRCPFTGNINGSMEQKVYSAFKMFASPTLDGGGGGGGGVGRGYSCTLVIWRCEQIFFFSGHVWDGQEYFGVHFFMCREMDILSCALSL